jgi:hypothetical protein
VAGVHALAALVLALAWPAAGQRTTCAGSISFERTKTIVVVLRGTTCAEAKRVVRAYDRGSLPQPWFCGLAHAPFTRIDGHVVGFSCAHGGTRGDLRRWPHAFLGLVAQ